MKTMPKIQRTRRLSSAYQINLMGHITASNSKLYQISSSESRPSTYFKISTKEISISTYGVNEEYQFQVSLDLKHNKTHLISKTHFTFIVILFYPIFYFAIKLPKVAVQRPNTIQSQFQMGSDFCLRRWYFR